MSGSLLIRRQVFANTVRREAHLLRFSVVLTSETQT